MATLEEIEKITKTKNEIKDLGVTKIAIQAELDNKLKELDNLHRNLTKLKSEKGEFIEARKKEIEGKLAMVDIEIEAKLKALEAINKSITSILSQLDEKMLLAVSQIDDLADKANNLVAKGDQFQVLSEDLFKKVNERILYLDEFIKKNSEKEKVLIKKENEVEEKYKLATEKLQKAKDIMYWHDKPGKYKGE